LVLYRRCDFGRDFTNSCDDEQRRSAKPGTENETQQTKTEGIHGSRFKKERKIQ
jgi:hypothetical protein